MGESNIRNLHQRRHSGVLQVNKAHPYATCNVCVIWYAQAWSCGFKFFHPFRHAIFHAWGSKGVGVQRLRTSGKKWNEFFSILFISKFGESTSSQVYFFSTAARWPFLLAPVISPLYSLVNVANKVAFPKHGRYGGETNKFEVTSVTLAKDAGKDAKPAGKDAKKK